jgi:hypothetical protein
MLRSHSLAQVLCVFLAWGCSIYDTTAPRGELTGSGGGSSTGGNGGSGGEGGMRTGGSSGATGVGAGGHPGAGAGGQAGNGSGAAGGAGNSGGSAGVGGLGGASGGAGKPDDGGSGGGSDGGPPDIDAGSSGGTDGGSSRGNDVFSDETGGGSSGGTDGGSSGDAIDGGDAQPDRDAGDAQLDRDGQDSIATTNVAKGGTVTASSPGISPEDLTKAFDENSATKWFAGDNVNTGWIAYQFAAGVTRTVTSYAITSANDMPARDPATWQLQGSNDGQTWTVIDTRTGESFASRFLTKTYSCASAMAYARYRLNVTANAGANALQLAELQLLGY